MSKWKYFSQFFARKYVLSIGLLVLLAIFILIGLSWMSFLLSILISLYIIFFTLIRLISNNYLQRILFGITSFFSVLVIAIFLRLFVFEIYIVPTTSMEPTLHPGDVILVNKLYYGPMLPRKYSDIPWFDFIFYSRIKNLKNTWKYRRLKGMSNVKSGDIFVMKKSNGSHIVKRCVGLPGEEVMVKNNIFSSSKNRDNKPPENCNDYKVVDSPKKNDKSTYSGQTFYFKKVNSSWNIGNFGPILIPSSGMEMALSSCTNLVYKDIISRESLNPDTLYESKGKEEKYCFNRDYFFVLGDYQNVSLDSRFLGFISEEQLVGKVEVVIFNKIDLEKKLKSFFYVL
ncbi:MAG: signal peptidase I [Bacteroidota bacterium]